MLSSYLCMFLILVLGVSALIICASIALLSNRVAKIITMSGLSSLVCCIYLLLDGPDVALTEAAINASISTIFMLILAVKIGDGNIRVGWCNTTLGATCFVLLLMICYDLGKIAPEVGNACSPINTGVTKYYTDNTYNEIGIPAIVTAVLADYRGFDTFCETLVILIGAIGVYVISGVRDERK